METVAANLARTDFPEHASLRFLRQVCRWGGYYGIAARVCRDNQPESLRHAFVDASTLLSEGDPVNALRRINVLRGLRRPSFASKVIRFVAPQSAAILDRIISERTGFPLTAGGYEQLIQASSKIAVHLAEIGVPNPVRSNGEWYIADIEAAFYADMEGLEA